MKQARPVQPCLPGHYRRAHDTDERQVIESLRAWLTGKGTGYRSLFWMTGYLDFFLSPILDNLTTALVMSAIVMAVGKDNASSSVSAVSISTKPRGNNGDAIAIGHLKWTPVIAVGSADSIVVHLRINAGTFKVPF